MLQLTAFDAEGINSTLSMIPTERGNVITGRRILTLLLIVAVGTVGFFVGGNLRENDDADSATRTSGASQPLIPPSWADCSIIVVTRQQFSPVVDAPFCKQSTFLLRRALVPSQEARPNECRLDVDFYDLRRRFFDRDDGPRLAKYRDRFSISCRKILFVIHNPSEIASYEHDVVSSGVLEPGQKGHNLHP